MTQVERTTEIEADAAEVWDALTDERLLGEWFGGDVSLELRPGGALRVTAPTGARVAVVDDVDAPTHWSFTWSGDDDHPPSNVHVDVQPHERGCTVRVREALIVVEPFPIGFRPPRRGEALALARR